MNDDNLSILALTTANPTTAALCATPDGHKIEASYWDMALIQALYIDPQSPS